MDGAAPVAFGAWLTAMRRTLAVDSDADVPCGSCTACCSAAQFVTIGPDEADALEHIPEELLFPAPGRPGHVVMGYDAHGRCPMLRADGCSIYAHRPVACRTYDCRIFAATDVQPDDAGVADRVRQWTFSYASDAERAEHLALQAAAVTVGRRNLPNATAVAVQALRE